jgi:hypothetical protein
MKSVVVCGSKKFKDAILEFCSELENLGITVFRPNIKNPQSEDKKFESAHIARMVFKGLTLEHFDYIRKSEVCFIFNKDGYVGNSVNMEIGFANALGKPIYALTQKTGDPCSSSLIDKTVSTPKELAKLLN